MLRRLAAALALACVSASVQAQPSEETLEGLRQLDATINDVGYRLARGSADLCDPQVPLAGLVPHDLAQYDRASRGAAARAFGLDEQPALLAVARHSAAAKAGILPDDILLSIDGQPFASGRPEGGASFEGTEQALGLIEQAFADGQARIELGREGRMLAVEVAAERGCTSRFQLVPSDRMRARADGLYVQVTSALALFAADEAELAALLAHELAHNILRHRERLDRAGIRRGLLQHFGRNALLIRETEIEADRLSVYILDRAGYPPETVAQLWERLGPRSAGILGTAPTHPDWRKRIESLRAEAETLQRQKASNAKPLPDFLAGR